MVNITILNFLHLFTMLLLILAFKLNYILFLFICILKFVLLLENYQKKKNHKSGIYLKI